MLERDLLIHRWHTAKTRLDEAKAEEAALRKEVIELFDPEKTEGTENIELANNWKLKAVKKLNYSLDRTATPAALEQLPAETADRLVAWSPKLSTSEYKKLSDEHKEIINEVLTIKPGAPTITLVEPK